MSADPFLTSSVAVATGFYGSLLHFACCPRAVSANFAIGAGAAAGSVTGIALLRFALSTMPELVSDNYVALHGACFGMHFWLFMLVGSWVLRDRFRPGVYGKLEHSYLEGVADGVLVLNAPLTAIVSGVAFAAAARAASFVLLRS